MKKLILLCLLFGFVLQIEAQAQKFLRPFETISHKKPSYITKEDGTEIEGTVKKLKRKKGLIKEIDIKTKDGKKLTIPIESIKYAYLPQSGWDKFTKIDSYVGDATQWEDGLYDQERLKSGYAYFEKAETIVKKKKMTLLMQLLNPGLCSRIKVYHDPFAGETTSFGVGGLSLAGGEDKSYYLSKDNEAAYKFHKKKYNKKLVAEKFGDCAKVKKEYKKAHWENFEKMIFTYNESCKK